MDICIGCGIEDKIRYCCGSNPETGEVRELMVWGSVFYACDKLSEDGICMIYETVYAPCWEYECPISRETELCELLGL